MSDSSTGRKFLFVGKDIKPYHRGAHSIGKRFSEQYSNWIDYIENDDLKDEWPQNYEKVIFTYHPSSKVVKLVEKHYPR